jgi:hypothetical protein
LTYVPPFSAVKGKISMVTIRGQKRVNNTYEELIDIIKLLLHGVQVDESWYLGNYKDVAEAVAAGRYKSAKHHFVEEGYFEGRRPAMVDVDQNWYLAQYPDVAEGIAKGLFKSVTDHFMSHGYEEGRLPAPY